MVKFPFPPGSLKRTIFVADSPGGMLGACSRLRPLPLSLVGWSASCNNNQELSHNLNHDYNCNTNNKSYATMASIVIMIKIFEIIVTIVIIVIIVSIVIMVIIVITVVIVIIMIIVIIVVIQLK